MIEWIALPMESGNQQDHHDHNIFLCCSHMAVILMVIIVLKLKQFGGRVKLFAAGFNIF